MIKGSTPAGGASGGAGGAPAHNIGELAVNLRADLGSLDVRKVQQSMTLQGVALIAAGHWVVPHVVPALAALGAPPEAALDVLTAVANAMEAFGVLMTTVGRLRLGDLR